jgi:hypothetical protein
VTILASSPVNAELEASGTSATRACAVGCGIASRPGAALGRATDFELEHGGSLRLAMPGSGARAMTEGLVQVGAVVWVLHGSVHGQPQAHREAEPCDRGVFKLVPQRLGVGK